MAEGVTEDHRETSQEKKNTEEKRSTRSSQRRRRGAKSNADSRKQFESTPPPKEVSLSPLPGNPRILSREEHCISRKNIDSDCLKVMQRLIRYGYRAFLVGGGVRDLLLEREPKDFDVGTEASPEQVRKLFRNSRIIGRRFRLNHVFFKGGKTIEVATLRQESTSAEDEEVQTLAKDNTPGDAETDARRRDLTINGLFYDLSTFSVVDYVGGIEDLRNSIVRVIGVPEVRFTEDPVRMIRAIRHAARTGFEIEEQTYAAICSQAESITLCPKARLFEEFQREIAGGYAGASFVLLEKTGLLGHLFPILNEAVLASESARELLYKRLERMDSMYAAGAHPRLGLLFGALLFDMLDESAFPDDTILLQYWKTNPEFNEHAEVAASPKVPTKSKRRISPLLQFIDMLFEEVGLPRKERERLERALASRFSLLEYRPDDSFGKRVRRSSGFEDALFLAELVDVEDTQKDLIAAWKSAATGGEQKQGRQRKRRRRKRNRGGGAGKNNRDQSQPGND